MDWYEAPDPDRVAAFHRPTSQVCPACPLAVTYAGLFFGSRRQCDPRAGRSAGPLWLAALYGVASTVGMWSSLNGVERILKCAAAVVWPVRFRPGGFAKRNQPGPLVTGGRPKLSPRRIDL